MKIIRNYLYNAGYQILALLVPIITAPYVSRTLSPSGVGINAYTNSIIQYFVLLGSIGITIYGNRQIAYVSPDKSKVSKTFYEIQIVKIFAIFLAYLFLFLFLSLGVKYRKYIWIQSLNILAAAVDISWLYMGLEDFKKTVIRNTIVKVTSTILIFIFVRDSSDVGMYILILAMSSFLGNLTLWPSLKKILVKIRISDLNIMPHIKPAVALFIPQIATQLYLQLNKTMLGVMVSTTSSGFYFSTDQLVKVVLSVVTATSTVMLPRVSSAFSKGNDEKVKQYLYDSFDFVSLISVAMAFGLASIGLKLGPLFYGKGFEPVGPAIMLESVVIIFIGWGNAIGMQYMLPTNMVKQYTKSILFGAGFNILANIPLIYFWGLNGAIIATVLSELIVSSYQLWTVRKKISLFSLFKNMPKYLFSGLVMFIFVFCMNLYLDSSWVMLILEIFIGVVIYMMLMFILKPSVIKKIEQVIEKFILSKRK